MICNQCIMDDSDKQIIFDENGICNHCHQHALESTKLNINQKIESRELERTFEKIKNEGKNKPYDSILGISGGVDSTYVAYLASKHGLRPLAVHLDNGWNSELAVHNINAICKNLKIDLHTHVIDWEEFRDLQVSFFKANVVDIEMLTDHAINATILNLAEKYSIKYMLSGANFATESVMPKSWVHRKSDLVNIRSIHKKFGTVPMNTFPTASTLRWAWAHFFKGLKTIKPLNMIEYNKGQVVEFLQKNLGWRPYSGKHYESVFTKFYQAYILPKKFNIDKRRAHYSSLILSKQMSRENALKLMLEPLYSENDLIQDKEFVMKKLGFKEDYFSKYIKDKQISHYNYRNDERLYTTLLKIKNFINYA